MNFDNTTPTWIYKAYTHVLCSQENQKVRIKCYKLGAQDYLTKPFNQEELDELVKKNLFHSLCHRMVMDFSTKL
jgi:FixJ family two-component response regulator